MKNLSEKLKGKNEEKMMYIPLFLKHVLEGETDITFSLVTKKMHRIIDILEKSCSFEEALVKLNL
jgi:hypothetical protein